MKKPYGFKRAFASLSLLLVLVMPSIAMATNCASQINNISDLPDIAKQQMIVECEQNKLNDVRSIVEPDMSADEAADMAQKWAGVANAFLGAINTVAKDLGVTINEFLPTPAGILTAVLITWEVMGDDIGEVVSSVVGCSAFVILGFIVLNMGRRYCKRQLVTKTETVLIKGWFGREKHVQKDTYCSINELDRHGGGSDSPSDHSWYYITVLVTTGIGLSCIAIGILQL